MAFSPSKLGWMAAIMGGLLSALTGCETNAFCFDCNDNTTTTSGSGATAGAAGDCGLFGCSGGSAGSAGVGGTLAGGAAGSGGTTCPGADFNDPKTCGTCNNNCYQVALNCVPATIGCTPSQDPGNKPGACTCGMCAPDYFDLDKDGVSCEYFCQKNADNDVVCNNKDDDCDGQKDEDVDFCKDPNNCGKCGRTCSIVHGAGACVQMGAGACTELNTQCQIAMCDCNGPGDCWHDADGSIATGCEYNCDLTNNGVEVCDGLDNDCDGKIDGADDLSADPLIGVVCHGDPDGECATAAHAGTTVCQGGLPVCQGASLLTENQQPEMCNGKDDNCDGLVDNNPADAGGSCGVSNLFPCSFGTNVCIGGMLKCSGAVLPGTESCNGIDDDCDGNIDKTGNMPPADAMGACNVPTPPPAGATSPCVAGMKACLGGQVSCVGYVGPTSAFDSCGDDSNCDGQLTNQPNLMTDVLHCGSCMNDCTANAVHAIVSCMNGVCQNQGCQPGYFDLDNNGTCEYPCTFVSAQEACNGIDDNCNGQTDENVIAPAVSQVCGVSPAAMAPECTSMVTVACMNGAWKCTFPAGVCTGGCSNDDEICDSLDNDCDGNVNENVPTYGKPCASDDGLPAPGDGACRTFGTNVCNGPNAVKCSAMKENCANLAGGCTELCDGVDNDCDGIIDETFNNKGSNAMNFVKPTVTKLAASLWMYTYEASRSSATNQAPGTGNGFWTSAPVGSTLDKTPACSVPSKIPWFNVTPQEVEQTCTAMGGAICTRQQFQTACQASCSWGYAPLAQCSTSYTATKFCNLAPSYDFNPGVAGDQDGLLPTASNLLMNCWSDWSGQQGNMGASAQLFDLTGNLHEITKEAANQYKLMGGAFNTESEAGAACGFTFYTVDQNFKFFDTGFRCCFTSDPTL